MKLIVAIMFLLSLLTSCSISSDFSRGYFVPANSQPVSIKFDRISKLIIIEAEINGVNGKFLFDNGFSLSAVSENFAKRANITFSHTSGIKDANNKRAKVQETTVKSVVINGQEFRETGFYLVNPSAFLPCDNLDGIIGASIINKANWKIDFNNQKILISSVPFLSDGFHLKTHFINNNSTLTNIEISGQKIKAKIDLGSSGGLKTSKKRYQKLFSGELAEMQYGVLSLSATGLGEIQSSYLTETKYELQQQGQAFPLMSQVHLRNKIKYAGYLGVDYFDEYLLIINSSNNEYILKPSKSIEPTQREKTYGVLFYNIDGQWKAIQKDAKDESLTSIKLMSHVQSLDNSDINRFNNVCSLREYIKTKKEQGETLNVSIDNTTYKLPYRKNTLSKIP